MNLNFVWDYNVVGRKMARYCHKLNGILLTKLFWPIVGKNSSSDHNFFFEIWGQEFAKFLRSLKKIYLNNKRPEHSLVTQCFFNFFLGINKLEELEFKLKKEMDLKTCRTS